MDEFGVHLFFKRNEIMKIKINENYPYIYETHLHTSQSSACAMSTGSEMARACKKAGYTGITVTDHFFYGNSCVNRSLSWMDWVEGYAKGYEDAKKEGDRLGLQVFFGWEAGYKGTEFLIYGLSKEWLLTHPEIKDATIEEQFQLVGKDGGMVIHAHPYREEFYIPEIRLFPEYIHGVEVKNATHSNRRSRSHYDPDQDALALAYAQNYGFPMIAGSDIHNTDLLLGGVAFARKIKDEKDFVKAVLGKETYLLLNGTE